MSLLQVVRELPSLATGGEIAWANIVSAPLIVQDCCDSCLVEGVLVLEG